jgi:3-dehydroquinate synthase
MTNPNSPEPKSDPRDIHFVVPQVHRLRTTWEVAGDDFDELIDVLHPSSTQGPKVALWADAEVARSSPRVTGIAKRLAKSEQVELVGSTRLIPGGELVKNTPEIIESLLSEINDAMLDRRSYIVAIGGGAMLDAVGYAAAIAHRGIRLVRVPTTTLAQADSGVGVKNAVNHFGKKNWVGTFAVPWAVINDAGFLTTLPQRDFACGFSEAVKVSLLKDASEFDFLCKNAAAIARRQMTIACRAIEASCQMHLQHITRGGDPFEALEARPLDFGHWSAHRLESLTEYSVRHGEAVAIGLALDCIYSSLVHGFPESDCRRVCKCLVDLGLSLWDETLEDFDQVLMGLEEFRQHLGGRLTVTMLRGVAQPIDVHTIDDAAMREACRRLRRLAAGTVCEQRTAAQAGEHCATHLR